MLYKTTTILEICGNFVHKILDEKFGKEGTVERAQAEEAACSFYSSQNIDFNKRDLTAELRGALIPFILVIFIYSSMRKDTN